MGDFNFNINGIVRGTQFTVDLEGLAGISKALNYGTGEKYLRFKWKAGGVMDIAFDDAQERDENYDKYLTLWENYKLGRD